MGIEKNAPCLCGSGKKFKKCCAKHVSPAVLRNDLTGERTVKLSDGAMEAFERQRERFVEKFGREMGPGDPVFFDPDADVPVPMGEKKIKAVCIAQMREVGMSEEFIHAYDRTGMMVLEENRHLFTREDLKEWECAVLEYRRSRRSGPEKS